MDENKWKECVAFHGHSCPGLAIGARAAEEAGKYFGIDLECARDGRIVCVMENATCAADAIQYLAGCTMGKSNIFVRDTGKMAFSFFLKDTGMKIRFYYRNELRASDRDGKINMILSSPVDDVFSVSLPSFEMPKKGPREKEYECSSCREAAAESKMFASDDGFLCYDCYNKKN